MCRELDEYLVKLEKSKGLGAISEFAEKIEVNRVTLWRYRTGQRKPTAEKRKKIKRLTAGLVLPENF